MVAKCRKHRIISVLIFVGLVGACKTPNRTTRLGSRSNASGKEVRPVTGSSSDWVTPFNLIDIDAPVQDATKVILTGDIERISLDNPSDVFSAGLIEMSGMRVIIPANMVLRASLQYFTLQELFTKATAACRAKNQTGLALSDTCFYESRAAIATILANRTSSGTVIAGEVKIEKANEFISGVVTYIDHNEGYFRINGNPKYPGSKTTGVMIRLNDPTARHSLQSGLACGAGPNCSPDQRFALEPDNYSAAFITGYPVCIPSTKTSASRGAVVAFNATTGLVSGLDARCPFTNRPANPATTNVADSKYFSPIKLGDSLSATGNFERIGGVSFLSAHTLSVHVGLKTTAGKPDYLNIIENIWEVSGFPRGMARAMWIGFSTDRNSQLDLYRLSIDPSDANEETRQHEIPIGSTVNNPGTFNIGVPPNINNIFRVHLKDNFVMGASGRLAPCVHLAYADLEGGCSSGSTLNEVENFNVLSPITQEVIARTRNKKNNPNLVSFDVSGKSAPNGQFTVPVDIDHPEFVEINLNRVQTPFFFTGQPWNIDRRLGVGGCGGARGSCSTPAALTPFPSDAINGVASDPRNQNTSGLNLPKSAMNRIIMGFPYSNTTDGPILPWESADTSNALSVRLSAPVIFKTCVPNP